ncbi:MAG: hypothetical protein AB7V46_18655, partial [Thermomicrobiales bacterium]
MQNAGFIEVETTLVEAPVVLGDAGEFRTFMETIVFREHIEQIPTESGRGEFLDELTRLAAGDDPPFQLDYWRLNMFGSAPAEMARA